MALVTNFLASKQLNLFRLPSCKHANNECGGKVVGKILESYYFLVLFCGPDFVFFCLGMFDFNDE